MGESSNKEEMIKNREKREDIMLKKIKSVLIVTVLIGLIAGCSDRAKEEESDEVQIVTQTQTEDKSKLDDDLNNDKDISTDKENEKIELLLEEFTQHAAQMNLDRMTELISIENYIDGYDEKKVSEVMGEGANVKRPAQKERETEILNDLSVFYAGFALDEKAMKKIEAGELEYNNLCCMIPKIDFSNLKISRIDIPQKEMIEETSFKKILERISERYSAEDYTYRTVLFELDGKTYYGGFTLIKYNGQWEIFELRCMIVKVDVNVITVLCSEDEYIDLIEEF